MIKVVIGLGNPGHRFVRTRHNSGFLILDALAARHNLSWHTNKNYDASDLVIGGRTVHLIKPLTFMNSSGLIVPLLLKKGIKPEEILVVHDELELPFGKHAMRCGGSARGHNGLKSLIAALGSDQFWRLRFGIGRPLQREVVPDYVLEPFSEPTAAVNEQIEQAAITVEHLLEKSEQ